MLIGGLLMFFNSSLREIFTRLTANTLGVIFSSCAATVRVSYSVAQKSGCGAWYRNRFC